MIEYISEFERLVDGRIQNLFMDMNTGELTWRYV